MELGTIVNGLQNCGVPSRANGEELQLGQSRSHLGFLPDGKMGVRSTLCLASNQGATWITWPHYLRRS